MAMSGGKRPGRKVVPATPIDAPSSIPAVLANPAMTAEKAITVPAPTVVKPAAPAKAPVFKPVAAKVAAQPIESPVVADPVPVAAVTPIVADAVADVATAIEPIANTITDTLNIVEKDMTMDATTAANTAANTATEKAQTLFAEANDRTKGAVEKGTKFFQEVTEFSKGNVEALVESSKIAAKGLESMGQDAAAYAKTSFESASEALRTMASIKSPTEFLKFQSDYVRSVFDGLVAQTSRGTEASLKLAGEVAQPISNRVAMAADKMKVVA